MTTVLEAPPKPLGLIKNLGAFPNRPPEFYERWQQDLETHAEWEQEGCVEEFDPDQLVEYRVAGMQADICGDRLHRKHIQNQLEAQTGVDNIHFHMTTGGGATLDRLSEFNKRVDRSAIGLDEIEFMLVYAQLGMLISHIHVPCFRAFHTGRVPLAKMALSVLRGKAFVKKTIGTRDIYPDVPINVVRELASRYKMACAITVFDGIDRKTSIINEDNMLVWLVRKFHVNILAQEF